jgi:hypothetical protein
VTLDTQSTKTPKTDVPFQRLVAARLRPVAAVVGARLAHEFGTRFRLPLADDPVPGARRIAAICSWAASLGIAGLMVGAMALIAMLGGAPGWYQPTVMLVGLGGIVCTIGAIASVHRYRLPFLLLGAATALLLTALTVTVTA